jgi:hypothetical protein
MELLYYVVSRVLKAKNMIRKHKVTMYKTLIKPVLMYWGGNLGPEQGG